MQYLICDLNIALNILSYSSLGINFLIRLITTILDESFPFSCFICILIIDLNIFYFSFLF